MTSAIWAVIATMTLLAPIPALAQDNGFFSGLAVTGGAASGSSDTTDGGAAFAGGGVVGDVEFDATMGIGGSIGYRFNRSWSAFLSIDHARGDVRWQADYPLFGVSSDFAGDASSTVVLGNLAYDWAASDATTITASAGLGLSVNRLSDVVETDGGTGIFLADLKSHSQTSPAAQFRIALRHELSPRAAIALNLTANHVGDFETGDTRSGNLGITEISPYAITDVWRADLGAGLYLRF